MERYTLQSVCRRGPRHLNTLLHYHISLHDGSLLLSLSNHRAHRPHQHTVTVGYVACRSIARRAHGCDPQLRIKRTRAHEELPVQGAGGHVEGAGVQQEGAASRRVAANGVMSRTSHPACCLWLWEGESAQLSKSRKAEVETNAYAHLFVKKG